MKITYLINQYPKVSHTFIRREIYALEQLGFYVQRIALRGWKDEIVDAQDRTERLQTQYVLKVGALGLFRALLSILIRSPLRFFKSFWLATKIGWRAERSLIIHYIYLAEACVISRWMIADQSLHLHAHFGTNPATVSMLVNSITNIPYSFTAHGPEEFDKPIAIKLGEKIKRAAFVVAISSFGRSQLFRWVTEEFWTKIHVVHCGLGSEFLDVMAPVNPVKARLVCVGRICEQKGQLLLVNAIRKVVDHGIAVRLILAGDGDMRLSVERLIRKLDLTDHVHITGWISGEQVKDEILQAQALVLPSFAEGLPVVIMEAMALCRPVISTYVAGIPELVRPNETGWLIPAGDVDAIATAIIECLASPASELEVMGLAARRRALLRHNVEIEAEKLAKLIWDKKDSSPNIHQTSK